MDDDHDDDQKAIADCFPAQTETSGPVSLVGSVLSSVSMNAPALDSFVCRMHGVLAFGSLFMGIQSCEGSPVHQSSVQSDSRGMSRYLLECTYKALVFLCGVRVHLVSDVVHEHFHSRSLSMDQKQNTV